MPNFSVPNSINPGDALDANKAMANWNQVVNDLNGAKVDNTNIAAGAGILGTQLANNTLTATQMNTAFANGNVEPAFSTWKPILAASGAQSATTTNHLLSPSKAVFQGSAPTGDFGPYYFDPAQYTAGSRTTKIRVRSIISCNSVFPGALTVTAFFGPLTTVAGASGSDNTYSATGVTASVAFATPAAGLSHGEGAAVTAPVAGFYTLAAVASGVNANALYDITVILEVQQI